MDGASLMPTMLAFTATNDDVRTLSAVTSALSRALHLTVRQRALPSPAGDNGAAVLRDIDDPLVRIAVLPYSAGHTARLVTDVIKRCSKPVVVVPVGRGASAPVSIDRVLVPLNGTVEAGETVAELVRLFRASGADIVVLHVFDKSTVPRFWDQPVHARKSWVEEFLSRYCDQPNVRMELRSGRPGDHILDVAASEHADLIALGWAQNLSAGRARTVRSTLAQATIPVLLLPLPSARDHGESRVPGAVETAVER